MNAIACAKAPGSSGGCGMPFVGRLPYGGFGIAAGLGAKFGYGDGEGPLF